MTASSDPEDRDGTNEFRDLKVLRTGIAVWKHPSSRKQINIVPVHYRGAAQAIADLIAGRVEVMFDIVVSSLAYINAGQLRALALATTTPHELLRGVPTIGEFVPGFEAGGWQGVCAPAKTPTEIIDRLNREINAVLADAHSKARLAELGGQPFAGTPA